jgi:AbrB family looped-hinge helix DNA binding protein
MLPKPLREALGLTAGSKVDITAYGAGLALVPESRTARLVTDEHGLLVAESDVEVTDAEMFALIDAGRR